jgi:hypothetical protein
MIISTPAGEAVELFEKQRSFFWEAAELFWEAAELFGKR